jgi:hypothetical protein
LKSALSLIANISAGHRSNYTILTPDIYDQK